VPVHARQARTQRRSPARNPQSTRFSGMRESFGLDHWRS